MKHHCHCGFKEHSRHFHFKKVGIAGAVFMVLHLLYHVVECLIIPAIFMAVSHTAGNTVDTVSAADTVDAINASIDTDVNTDIYTDANIDASMNVNVNADADANTSTNTNTGTAAPEPHPVTVLWQYQSPAYRALRLRRNYLSPEL